MRLHTTGQLLGVLFSATTFTPQATAADVAEIAKLFGARPAISAMNLSPTAEHVVYLAPQGPRETAIVTAETTTGKIAVAAVSSGNEFRIRNCFWGKADRIICKIDGESDFDGAKFGYSRTIAMNRDGSAREIMGFRATRRSIGLNRSSGRVIDLLPNDPKHILMEVPFIPENSIGPVLTKDKIGLGVKKIDINTGQGETIEPPIVNTSYFLSDDHGNVRLRVSYDVDTRSGQLKTTGKIWYRNKNTKQWRHMENLDFSEKIEIVPESFDESGNYLYVRKSHNGRQAMFKIALDGVSEEKLVFAHDIADVDGLVTFGQFDRPVGVSYSTDFNHIEYFDSEVKSLAKALAKAIPGKEVTLMEDSADGSNVLLVATADIDPGAYYIFNRTSRQLKQISAIRPNLASLQLAKTAPVSYRANDGTQVPGFLTLPPGANGKNLPLVVMPHGGSSSRDYWGFDWFAQFFAAIGYAVLQPNYRGSSGYGSDWRGDNAFQNWRTTMSDINDGVRWAVSTGLADAKRAAIIGWGYGGYAALQANVIEPGLYRAAIAIAPITDLEEIKDAANGYYNEQRVAAYIGSGPHITEGSPARNAAAIKAPVMLFHGSMDLNVDVKQSRRMKDALTGAGKRVEYIEYKDLEHSLVDSSVRADMLTRIGNFLAASTQ